MPWWWGEGGLQFQSNSRKTHRFIKTENSLSHFVSVLLHLSILHKKNNSQLRITRYLVHYEASALVSVI